MPKLLQPLTFMTGALLLLASLAVNAAEQVPFGDKVSSNIFNYHRHTPTIATSGTIEDGGFKELQTLGFKTIVDMRTEKEGTAAEQQSAKDLGLSYYNLAVGKDWPSDQLLAEFKRLVEDQTQHPLLIHCASANRVGMIWSYYRIAEGINRDIAIAEGRTIGMKPSREAVLLKQLEPTH